MKAKEYLLKLQRLDVLISQRISTLDALKEQLTSIPGMNPTGDRVQTSPKNEAPFVNVIMKIESLQKKLNEEIDAFVDMKQIIIKEIEEVENLTYEKILFKRYVEFKKLADIAVEMNYSYDYIRELHGKALQAFESSHSFKQHNT